MVVQDCPSPKCKLLVSSLDAGRGFVGETENGTDDIWWIDEDQDYPSLWWEAPGIDY